MGFGWDIQQKLKSGWLIFISLFIFVYCSFNLFCGDRNIYRYFALQDQIAEAKERALMYAKQKNKLQQKVNRLSDAGLDTDLLDEQARVVLNMAADDEFIIPND